ncbi:beta-ketoacyl synthase N-terminal-like domain-containing protein, partial [Nocardia sp. NPDC051052]|uniref:beta-ketoacyl synthase N-terminal-like domain-containing protein n=1 Tax=Nocardia sp. NPDC051052 TaxID=3364322 RepID=UPI0037AE983C
MTTAGADGDLSRLVAVVGMSCRFPMARTVEEFWQLLWNATDAVHDVEQAPRDPSTESYDDFDAEFFGMSPAEAAATDPRQKVMLELAWEALEDARIPAEDIRETSTAVFIGASSDEHTTLALSGDRGPLTRYSMTGLHRSIIANRVSYFLGLSGPSLTVDAAQSSALVAVHLGYQSIVSGESSLVLAGGVSLNLSSRHHEVVERFGALSPDGRCFTFDSRANGFVRGEGGGLVVLKPLAAALAAGDPVYCVIRGTAVNNDGFAESLTRPNPIAQEQVIRNACRQAHVDPMQVQYIELHGSGTSVGDPIEATAIGAVRRPGDCVRVGSVKTNIGHLDGAGGIAGFMKTALSIANRTIPASLNFEKPNPDIDFENLRIRVQQTTGPWPRMDLPLIAGVSSFGMGGTNCHVVLGEPIGAVSDEPADSINETDAAESCRILTFPVSTVGRSALRARARQLVHWLADSPNQSLADLSYSLVTTRAALSDRAVIVAANLDDLTNGLQACVDEMPAANLAVGRAIDSGTVFVFPGQGSQWPGMALDLLRTDSVFAESMAACDRAIAAEAGWSVLDVLRSPEVAEQLERVAVVQPILFAVMVSLAAFWRASGVEPAAVAGHSQGEVAAAHVAGGLTLADAAKIVVLRGRAVAAMAGAGGMASVELSKSAVSELLGSYQGRLGIAAINGPDTTIVAGGADALGQFMNECAAEGIRVRAVAVDYASHTAHVDVIRTRLLSDLADIEPVSSAIPFYSTVIGTVLDTAELDAEYWFRNLRSPVEFEATTRALLDSNMRRFIEVSPHPVLTAALGDTVASYGADEALVMGTLRRGDGGPARFLSAIAQAYVHGAMIDWTKLPGAGGRRIRLPHYPFQRTSHRLSAAPRQARSWSADATAEVERQGPEPVLGLIPHREQLGLVQATAAAILGHSSPAMIDPDKSFRDLGFDSVAVVELSRRLAAAAGAALPTTVVYDHPSPRQLADHLKGGPSAEPSYGSGSALHGPEDPVVITGMACRLPGGIETPEELWALVAGELEAVGSAPPDRHWNSSGKVATGLTDDYLGGFLDDVAQFDAEFFGISPREAEGMDPQQRLLLETTWEAFERAGIAPTSLRGSRTGVFVGAMAQDYGPRMHEAAGDAAGYVLTGTATSVASGRIAYTLGTVGPALTVDTACSSSLVALHLACRALRAGECDMAVAGGVTVMTTPGMFIEFARQGGLSPDGRCKAFAASADGTAWAEGVGLVIVERRSSALDAGRPILAVVRGTAMNHDGASNGLTAPSAAAQESVLSDALRDAGLKPADVSAVEAHGTGTRLGDPIEARAVINVYGRERHRPLWLGSLKSNIGHTQAAAGVAGVIKMVLAMQYGVLPKTLHVDAPSSHVDWSSGAVSLLTAQRLWQVPERGLRRAGVSSFGISGTNAHVILEQAPEGDAEPNSSAPGLDSVVGGVVPWVLSARSEQALRSSAERLARFVGEGSGAGVSVSDVGWSLLGRSRFEHCGVVSGVGRERLLSGLSALSEGRADVNVVSGEGVSGSGKTVLVFPGQGGQWLGMGRELCAGFPVFV